MRHVVYAFIANWLFTSQTEFINWLFMMDASVSSIG